MSTKKTIPPIQPAPIKPFTVRLVDGHFVQVPKLDHTAQTDATRPPAALPPDGSLTRSVAIPASGAKKPPLMRLVNGKFVRVGDQVADAGDASLTAAPRPVTSAPRVPEGKPKPKDGAPTEDSWDITFGTDIDPSDLPSES